MDEALRQYQADILKARLSRRGFLAAAGFAAVGAALAACSTGSASSAPSESTAAGGASAPASGAPSTAATAAPSYGPIESEFFLFNWSDYFSPDDQKAFSQQFGIKNFVYDTYPSNDELLAKLQASGGKGQYDVAVPTAEMIPGMVRQGFIQKLDKSRLPNLQYISKQFRGMVFDPTDDYMVPKDWGTTGIIYRGNKVKEPVTSWKDFWDLATGKYSGKALVVDSPGDVFVAPLRMHGFDVNTTNKDELEIARQELMRLRPHLQSIDSDNYPQTLRDEVAVLALAWNGTAYLMETDQTGKYKDTGYTIPSEGTIYWTDTWVMIADAPHPNAAYAFLNWIQDPHNQVTESLYAGYASCNEEAKKYLPPDFVANPAVYVPESQMSLLSTGTDQTGNQQRADIWAEFKQG